jgi:hypothetical protein
MLMPTQQKTGDVGGNFSFDKEDLLNQPDLINFSATIFLIKAKYKMNTKLLMVISAVVLGVAGILLIFIPDEISHFLNLTESASVILPILGALYFGFAMLNWTAKANLIGGIYSRPVAIGNFTHFLIGALALIKLVLHHTNFMYVWVGATLYSVFALLFGWIFFTNPTFSANKKFNN